MRMRPYGRTGLSDWTHALGDYVPSGKIPVVAYSDDAAALRFAAFADGVDSVIVVGASTAHIDRDVAAVARGPLAAAEQRVVHAVYQAHAHEWGGLV
jgi:hypothetical protein